MTPIYVSMPFACFRSAHSSEYVETELLPPPSTAYGCLLSLVGETSRRKHLGVRVSPGYLHRASKNVVYRMMNRVRAADVKDSVTGRAVEKITKNGTVAFEKKVRPVRVPDRQEILSNVELCLWLDSSEETVSPTLEERVIAALAHPETVTRFGGLCMGESQFLVNKIKIAEPRLTWQFLLSDRGLLSQAVWVDHVGGKGTIYAVGELRQVTRPDVKDLPTIRCA